MSEQRLILPPDAKQAIKALFENSKSHPVLVFKKSPICEISAAAEGELQGWLASRPARPELSIVWVDVIGQRPLARGLTSELNIAHESPQLLLFYKGALKWHGSHGDINVENLRAQVDSLA